MTDQHFSLHTVIELRQVTPSISKLVVERQHKMFLPGQHFPLRLSHVSIVRDFSVYSSIQQNEIEFLIRHIPSDAINNAILSLRSGDSIELGEAEGIMISNMTRFNDKEIWFIATGTGIVPFHSIIQSNPQLNYYLIHGIRLLDDAIDAHHYQPGRYVRCVSCGSGGEYFGRLTGYLYQQNVSKQGLYFLSGNAEMVFEVSQWLMKLGIERKNIRSDQL